MFYPLTHHSWGKEEADAVLSVLTSEKITMGEKVESFENAMCQYHGRNYAVMTNSGSSANLIAVAAFIYNQSFYHLKPGDEVIVPALAWSTTYAPLQQYGLKLRVVDIDLDTLNIRTDILDYALTKNTKMLIGVNILGNPADLHALRKFATDNGLIFLEDNCESIGASTPDGKYTGTFGDISTFSFFYSHQLSTGEGGMLLTDNDELFALARSLREHGWTRNVPVGFGLNTTNQFYLQDSAEYNFILPGYNVRPQEINGAVGLVQLCKLKEEINLRRLNLEVFRSLFGSDERYIIQREFGKSSSFAFTIILKDPKIQRKRVFQKLREARIEFRMITGGDFYLHNYFKHFDCERVGPIKNAEIAHTRGFFVGNYSISLEKQLTVLHEVLAEVCQ